MATISIIGTILALALMIFLAWKGVSIYVYTLVCTLVVILTGGMAVKDTLTNVFMGGFSGTVKAYFLMLSLSAVFAKVIGDSGAADTIARAILSMAKKSEKNSEFIAMLCIMSVSFLFSLGGISTFVVVFLMVRIAVSIYKELDLPWHLYTTGAWAASTCTMTMIPGSPQVQNLMPIKYLGTTPTAAPVIGILCALLCIALEMVYIRGQLKKARRNGEHFLPTGAVIQSRDLGDEKEETLSPSGAEVFKAFVPSIVLLLVLNLPWFGNSAELAMTCGILTCTLLYWKNFDLKSWLDSLSKGFANSFNVVLGLAAIVGFGKVVQATVGYARLIELLQNIPGTPLIQLGIVINICAAVAGSASGGLTIGLESFAQRFLDMGINPQHIHRIAAIACGGFDSLPHNSAVIIALGVQGLTHKQAYKHFFWECCIIPIACLVFAIVLASFGVC